MKVPQIYFENYILRDVRLDDAADMFEYGSDPEVIKFLTWGPHENIGDSKHAIKTYFLQRPAQGLPVGYAIVDTNLNKMIGTIDFVKLINDHEAEIGYVLNKTYWKQGIMTKALRKVLEVGFYTLRYEKIHIRHLVDNVASMRLIQKSGFTYTGEGTTYDRFTGGTLITKDYVLLKENFK